MREDSTTGKVLARAARELSAPLVNTAGVLPWLLISISPPLPFLHLPFFFIRYILIVLQPPIARRSRTVGTLLTETFKNFHLYRIPIGSVWLCFVPWKWKYVAVCSKQTKNDGKANVETSKLAPTT